VGGLVNRDGLACWGKGRLQRWSGSCLFNGAVNVLPESSCSNSNGSTHGRSEGRTAADDGTNGRTTCGADRAPAQGALLSRGHIGAPGHDDDPAMMTTLMTRMSVSVRSMYRSFLTI
jgi:hypothetical protein